MDNILKTLEEKEAAKIEYIAECERVNYEARLKWQKSLCPDCDSFNIYDSLTDLSTIRAEKFANDEDLLKAKKKCEEEYQEFVNSILSSSNSFIKVVTSEEQQKEFDNFSDFSEA